MVNITHKNFSLRKAIAGATLKASSRATIEAVEQRRVPKGDVLEFARAAGLLAIKKTSDVIPDCHPLPVEYAAITCTTDGLEITITVEVHTIYKTGVEVEAMHGAAITALTMYDMLKPIDKHIEIGNIRLISKEGGKSDRGMPDPSLTAAVVVCSDTVSRGEAEDRSGSTIVERLEGYGLQSVRLVVIPDEAAQIKSQLQQLSSSGTDLIIFTGGTGVSPRDITPDVIRPMLQTEIPGIMEAARNYGQFRMPFAMLSRGVAGFYEKSLVLTLPGSVKGVIETMDAVFPQVLHLFTVKAGRRHDDGAAVPG